MIEPDLSGRTTLVTGSAKGIGRGLLLALARTGGDVAVHYRSSEAAAKEVAERARSHGVDATVIRGDVTIPADVESMFSSVEEELGPVDVLVNNVGTFAPQHWTDIDFDTWQTVMETNFYGTYLCSKRAVSGMRDRSYGRIVNVGYASSEKGLVDPKNFPYFVAKNGVLLFTRMLAADTQDDGITVNAISPYTVENSDVFPDELPRGRPARIADLVQAMNFFLDEGSEYISGQNVEISGGWLPESV